MSAMTGDSRRRTGCPTSSSPSACRARITQGRDLGCTLRSLGIARPAYDCARAFGSLSSSLAVYRTLREIAEALNAQGVQTARGGQSYAMTVRNALARA
jgi:hypothetical protein